MAPSLVLFCVLFYYVGYLVMPGSWVFQCAFFLDFGDVSRVNSGVEIPFLIEFQGVL